MIDVERVEAEEHKHRAGRDDDEQRIVPCPTRRRP
jgi:hypothetical protein